MNRTLLLPVLLHLSGLAGPAQSSVLLQEMALHSMLESTASVLTTLGDYAVLNPDGLSNGSPTIGQAGIAWRGTYSDTGWTYSGSGQFGGMALQLNFSGSLRGSDGSAIAIAVVGSGTLGSQPLAIGGNSTWLYDAASDDYLSMIFRQETKIGDHSHYGWVVGFEKLLCILQGPTDLGPGGRQFGTIAGPTPTVLIADASSGKKTAYGAGFKWCYTPVNFAGDMGLTSVSSTGKKGSLTVSSMRKSALSQSPQAAPAFGAPFSDFLAADNQGTLVAGAGGLDADDMDNRYRSSGQAAAGNFSGVTASLPEPGMAGLLATALLTLGLVRRLRSKPTVPEPPATA